MRTELVKPNTTITILCEGTRKSGAKVAISAKDVHLTKDNELGTGDSGNLADGDDVDTITSGDDGNSFQLHGEVDVPSANDPTVTEPLKDELIIKSDAQDGVESITLKLGPAV